MPHGRASGSRWAGKAHREQDHAGPGQQALSRRRYHGGNTSRRVTGSEFSFKRITLTAEKQRLAARVRALKLTQQYRTEGRQLVLGVVLMDQEESDWIWDSLGWWSRQGLSMDGT